MVNILFVFLQANTAEREVTPPVDSILNNLPADKLEFVIFLSLFFSDTSLPVLSFQFVFLLCT